MIQKLEIPVQDRCITLYDIGWEKFEAIASLLEDYPVRLTYFNGTLDIMTPSPEHEDYKSTIGILLEVYLRFMGVRFYARGGPILGSREVGARGEPDESYNLDTKKEIPDLDLFVCCLNMSDQYDAMIAFSQTLEQQK